MTIKATKKYDTVIQDFNETIHLFFKLYDGLKVDGKQFTEFNPQPTLSEDISTFSNL